MPAAKKGNMRQPPGTGFSPGQMSTLRLLMHLPSFIKLYSRLYRDPRVGSVARAVLVFTVLYVLSPIDLICNFLVPFGLIDDIIVAVVGLKTFIRLCPKRVVAEHVEIIDQGA